ncbi:DUF222 domain-containing protein [Jiangella asiatica]|uniref:DUF222 domain-containing protein n=1 Tax=Jiangella asiatica TaxID=2530372 RepID=A0A4R5DEM0_9ACTN|nr:DUF222 domain-containing protein [Jiangella asiatica]TDE08783.1 DUF222 domain-containing protein [Jiangella asiatica]
MIAPGDRPSAAWRGLPPGTVLNAVIETLDLRSLPRPELVDAAVAAQRQVAHLDALRARVVAELAARPDPPGGDATAATVAQALALEPEQAGELVELAVELVRSLPATLTALDEGRITVDKAAIIARHTRRLAPSTRATVEAVALARAPELTESQLRRWMHDAMSCGEGHCASS